MRRHQRSLTVTTENDSQLQNQLLYAKSQMSTLLFSLQGFVTNTRHLLHICMEGRRLCYCHITQYIQRKKYRTSYARAEPHFHECIWKAHYNVSKWCLFIPKLLTQCMKRYTVLGVTDHYILDPVPGKILVPVLIKFSLCYQIFSLAKSKEKQSTYQLSYLIFFMNMSHFVQSVFSIVTSQQEGSAFEPVSWLQPFHGFVVCMLSRVFHLLPTVQRLAINRFIGDS